GREKLVKHETNFLNRDNPILGAYAVVKTSEDEEILTVMTMKEITASWSQAKTKNVQNKFPQEMAKRTVINRAAKAFINTSHNDHNLNQEINNSTADEYEKERRDITPKENQAQNEENDNQKIIDKENTPKETETLEEKQKVIDA